MAEIALGILGPAIEVVKWVAAPIKRQFNYLCCFTSNIKDLQEEAKNLDAAKDGLQMKVDHENDNVQPILPEVLKWLKDYEDIIRTMTEIKNDVPHVETGCSKLVSRYRLSRRAKKETARMEEHRKECKFDNVALPAPPAAREALPTGTMYDHFKSRKHIEDGIMTALEGKDFNMIGLCGMGGAGKTTMAVEITNKLKKAEVFEEVVMVVITQQVDKLKIQNEIAGQLDLEFKEGEVERSRVQRLHARLAPPRRVLVLLDDVWEKLALEELGIPCKNGSPGCKVLVTSRDTKVLFQMEMGKVFMLEELSDEESWILFRGKAGACVDGAELKPIAEGVMKQCGGLPIALAAVGEALKDVKNIAIWRNALRQLRNANPAGISKVIEKVYKPLRLSYDRLGDENEDAKSLFLLCCLFPEDYNIPLGYLTYFAIGLHLFKEVLELKEARDMTTALIETLRNRCLLLDGSDEDHVRMHDVVRDVSIFIAEEERRVKCSDCTWISSHVDGGARYVSREESCFPELKLLWMNNKVEQETDNLIGGSTTGLNVLFIEYGLLKSLPLIISLTTLVLHDCDSLESIVVVGQLESLEILICRYCCSIKEFPEQIKGLKRLKLLEISRCEKLKRIAAGVISRLVALEELKIVNSFNDWKGGQIDQGRNGEASLREIESLEKLRCLNIDVSDIALAAQPLHLSFDKLVQFTVRFGGLGYVDGESYQQSYQRRMYLKSLDKGDIIDVGDLSANIFLTHAECLYLSAKAENNQDFNLNLATVQNIRWLNLEYFTIKKNITSAVARVSFPRLEYLRLAYLRNLEEIWDDAPIPSNSFNNLKELKLVGLRALKRMGKCVLSTAKDFFLQLESIYIEECTEMEHLLELVPNVEEQDKEDHSTVLIFPKLKTVVLSRLPKLTNLICSTGIESIQFPLLAELKIFYCENLKWIVSRDDDEDDSLHLFCNPKVSFPTLEKLCLGGSIESKNVRCDKVPISFFKGLVELRIWCYGKIRRLFSSSSKIPQNLVNLDYLLIVGCEEMVKVIEDDDEDVSSSSCDHPTNPTTTPLFPSLQYIRLYELPKLESFCEWRCAHLELPSLKTVEITYCKEMKSFNAGAGSLIITPALQTVEIDGEELECVDDLNAALLQHFEKAKFRSLRRLYSTENTESENVWCDQVPMSFFTGLVELRIFSYGKMRRLFSSSSKIPQNLVNLQQLWIKYCDEMVKVIEDDDEDVSSSSSCDHPTNPTTTPLFPSLQVLWLYMLPKLESFCDWRCADLELPSLKKVRIDKCCEMKSFNATAGSLIITPALQTVTINRQDLESVDDLNAALHQHFQKAKKHDQEQREAREAAYRNRMVEEEEEKKKKKKKKKEVVDTSISR